MRLAPLSTTLLLLVLACAPTTPVTPAAPVTPAETRSANQVLRIATGTIPGNITPQSSTANPWLFFPIYDSLVLLGPGFDAKPSIATKWDLAANGTIWTFTIRKDVTWPGGDPLTADDVAFTLNTAIQQRWASASLFASVSTVRALDPVTVEITTKAPDMTVLNNAGTLFVIPKKYYEQVGFDGFVAKPVGSGPYQLAEFKGADTVRFTKRSEPHAFRKPVAQEIIFRNIPDNGQKINGLRTGDLDMVLFANFSVDQADQVKQAGMTISAPLAAAWSISFPQGVREARDTPLKDKRVRLAMNYAVNKDAIAKTILKGYGEPVGQWTIPTSPYWDPDAKPIPYDPAMAKKLLVEAGYPNGFKLDRGLDTSIASLRDMEIAVQSDLKAVGIEFAINPQEFGVILDKSYGRSNATMSELWAQNIGDSNGFFSGVRTFHGCGKPLGGNPEANQYCNPEWDRLLDQAQSERDPAKRAQLMRQANKLQRDDAQFLFGFVQPVFYLHSPRVRGFELTLPTYFTLDGVYLIT